ncbi:hypothetical protein GLOTRDRAFT_102141 [Gloeophyllum trabeum ATCC 11539]|uniref:ARM repeat-containing protein n=1 Tax=Gloeophyllum trabeum (strain ATCC 11539 / FP-39264 / Madison 617) TaxID=670483 RepID=S7S3D5_GLOTA|nr:uncharacterized protein GLOTRDRAFT_102141 [Gloeophyllum trabeum ATCC 11539]EPQ60349.1 hypothetical protein GLOTRDRAFT_102141 [Gloeophyllum trabeum ATCC 11539]
MPAHATGEDEQRQAVFQKLKKICVPLLGNSSLTPSSIPNVFRLLVELLNTLDDIGASGFILTPSLISYVFFPISTILRRNPSREIPDQILEKILGILFFLSETWWWDCDIRTWEQVFLLSSAILTGMESKGKGRMRSDETKAAAIQCLLALLRERNGEERIKFRRPPDNERARLLEIQGHIQSAQFIPVLGQTLDSSLMTSTSEHLTLQRRSLQLLELLVRLYLPSGLAPSVLPGVVSTMCKVALGLATSKTSANGEIVAGALAVLRGIIIKAIGDDICVAEGAVRDINDLEDLLQTASDTTGQNSSQNLRLPYTTPRTDSWLRGTASQLHIAINSLTPLISHPNPVALRGLASFSAALVSATSLTLPQTQPLLLSMLLSLSLSDLDSVARLAEGLLVDSLSPSAKVHHALWRALMRMMSDHLAAIPRFLPTHSDAKVEHSARIIEAISRVSHTISGQSTPTGVGAGRGFSSVSSGISKLLGPTGGIEKWGWALLSVLEFLPPTIVIAECQGPQSLLENGPIGVVLTPFPAMTLRNISSRSTFTALERMLRSLGTACGDECLYTVEWFASVGLGGRTIRAVAALWCGSRLLEGVSGVELDRADSMDSISFSRSSRLQKLARILARNVSELWDEVEEGDTDDASNESQLRQDAVQDENMLIEYRKGLIPVSLGRQESNPIFRNAALRPSLHKAVCLQLIALTTGILQSRATPLFVHTLYPVLHSMVSTDAYLAETASVALNFITYSTSFASPSNLVLSNFDYILDAVSRRFTRRWLDMDAAKVLMLLIRLAGRDVVSRAGDVVEECFDRLDEFHGYEIVVEGLLEVLSEVIKVIAADEEAHASKSIEPDFQTSPHRGKERLDAFFTWFHHRHQPLGEDPTDYGPAPRRPWGKDDSTDAERPSAKSPDSTAQPPPTPTQALTKQIVSRSLYFLTHGVPSVRARILLLLSSAVPVLPESALLSSLHHAWPFVLNRLSDAEPYVVSAAAQLIEALTTHVGSFMSRRIWDDAWPRFRTMLNKLETADATNALARRGPNAIGTESAYTHSHRLYRALLRTMTAAIRGVRIEDAAVWDVIMSFRRFLANGAHNELQKCARDLYKAIGKNNEDAVWLVLSATSRTVDDSLGFMLEERWQIETNANIILTELLQDNSSLW